MDKSKKEILESVYCDVLLDACPNPELSCDRCYILQKNTGKWLTLLHAIIDGWVEEGEKVKKSIPTKCPKCGRKLNKADSSRLCGIIFVYCMNLKCRYAEEYEV